MEILCKALCCAVSCKIQSLSCGARRKLENCVRFSGYFEVIILLRIFENKFQILFEQIKQMYYYSEIRYLQLLKTYFLYGISI